MGYYVSNMIGIRTGGVFSGPVDMNDFKGRVKKIILKMHEENLHIPVGEEDGDPTHCMSKELTASKGSYIVFAGVFNYWTFNRVSIFAERLSEEFGTEVMLMCWDEQENTIKCQIYLDGKELYEINENPLGKVIRRMF